VVVETDDADGDGEDERDRVDPEEALASGGPLFRQVRQIEPELIRIRMRIRFRGVGRVGVGDRAQVMSSSFSRTA
jgi:hypothetical protein